MSNYHKGNLFPDAYSKFSAKIYDSGTLAICLKVLSGPPTSNV